MTRNRDAERAAGGGERDLIAARGDLDIKRKAKKGCGRTLAARCRLAPPAQISVSTTDTGYVFFPIVADLAHPTQARHDMHQDTDRGDFESEPGGSHEEILPWKCSGHNGGNGGSGRRSSRQGEACRIREGLQPVRRWLLVRAGDGHVLEDWLLRPRSDSLGRGRRRHSG